MEYIFFLIFYGFIVTAVMGLLASWLDRKITARVQYRVGPPVFQPFVDIIKLLGKETLIPENASRGTFLFAPAIGLSAVVLTSTILWVNNLRPKDGFVGDLIVVLYLLAIPSISIIVGGFASGNPLASIGSSREMKLILAYELPFILAVFVPVIHSNFSIKLGDILTTQSESGVIAGSWSGFLALMVAVICMQAKLALVPFDIPEAETEITHGPLIEYSGPALAIYRLMKNMLLFVLPFFIIMLFMGGLRFDRVHILYGLSKYITLVLIITVIRNTNPRVRIDQAVKFFWSKMTSVAVISVILAFMGL